MSFLTPYEEKLLLKKISGGSEKAFRALYDVYFPPLSVYIYKICKSEPATEEMVQDIFLKLWANREMLRNIDSPEAYIFSMARNRTIDYLRMLAKETRLISTLSIQVQAYNNNIEERLNATALQQLIEEALEQLSEQKQTIFRLSKQEGLSHDEIAARMQLSKSTVKNHLSETLQHIRGHIRQQPNPEVLLLLFSLTTLS